MAECCHPKTHSHGEGVPQPDHGAIVEDPVCAMKVDTRTAAHRHELGDTIYYFCSARCLEKLKADPDRYMNPPDRDPAVASPR